MGQEVLWVNNGTSVFTLAGFWKRVYSNMIDYIAPLLVALYGIINPYFAFVETGMILFMVCVGWVLASAIWLVSMKRFGNTWAKGWAGIMIINENGKTPSLLILVIRELLKLISLVMIGIGFAWIIWDKQKQGLHDKIFKTHVVKVEVVG